MSATAKTPMSFQTVRRMSATQIAKLNKEQLLSALRDAVKETTDESRGSPMPPSTPVSGAITLDAIDKLLIQRLEPITQTISILTNEMKRAER